MPDYPGHFDLYAVPGKIADDSAAGPHVIAAVSFSADRGEYFLSVWNCESAVNVPSAKDLIPFSALLTDLLLVFWIAGWDPRPGGRENCACALTVGSFCRAIGGWVWGLLVDVFWKSVIEDGHE